MSGKHKIVKVGIMPLEEFKRRTVAIAQGKYKPKRSEPKIWFNSMRSLASVLSEDNQNLLKLIADIHPKSIRELELATGKKASALLRILRTMENYGFVKLEEKQKKHGKVLLVPHVIYDTADIEISFSNIR